MSSMLTSADIQDGKVEIDRVTKVKTTYKVIDGGYEVITETPVPGGVKTEKRTFWDPKPVTEEELIKEEELKRKIKSRYNREIRIDQNTTMLTREIEGGYEEVFTTTNADGTKSSKTKTHYFSVPADQLPAVGKQNVDKAKNSKKALLKKSSVDSVDSVESRQVVKQQSIQDSHNNYRENTTIEQSSRITQHSEITENNRTIRKNSVQEQSIRATQSSNTSDGKTKKKKTKSNIPPPPPDFIQNDTTTIKSKRVPGGMEYIYSTELESGQTITTSKTVFEEEEHELTEQEIKEYKKTLKDAEKHKNITQAKKLKSTSGTKKVVPSENPGEVTTVETIEIDGGTEYHYTTVTAEGIVKKTVKTVYDPIENEEEEQEIIEDYEEEIIEPGEKTYKTIESVKHLPKKFEEEVTITTEKKERKVKKSMMISS